MPGSGTLWSLIGGAVFTVLVAVGGFFAGKNTAALDCAGQIGAMKDKVIVEQQVQIKEVPKIITKYVQTTTTVEKTYHDAIEVVPDLFDPNCIMPTWWGELFVNAANGVSRDPRRTGKVPGVYGCLETATATLKDLKAGASNTAQASGVHAWALLNDVKGDK